MIRPKLGDIVRIGRDETKYPSKGTWPEFRGRTGMIVEFNLGEIGIVFDTKTAWRPGRPRPGNLKGLNVYWFQPYEVATLAPSLPLEPTKTEQVYR